MRGGVPQVLGGAPGLPGGDSGRVQAGDSGRVRGSGEESGVSAAETPGRSGGVEASGGGAIRGPGSPGASGRPRAPAGPARSRRPPALTWRGASWPRVPAVPGPASAGAGMAAAAAAAAGGAGARASLRRARRGGEARRRGDAAAREGAEAGAGGRARGGAQAPPPLPASPSRRLLLPARLPVRLLLPHVSFPPLCPPLSSPSFLTSLRTLCQSPSGRIPCFRLSAGINML